MPRFFSLVLAVSILIPTSICVGVEEDFSFPEPGEEVWELISDTGASRISISDRCCAFDGRNRLYVCDTGNSSAQTLRRWDGESWARVDVPDDIWSICSGPDNIVLLGEGVGMGYVRDDNYHEIEMAFWYPDCQYTTCFEDETWVLSGGPEDGLQRTNWRDGGGDWLPIPPVTSFVWEIDAWRGLCRWATCSDGLYYQQAGGDWVNISEQASVGYPVRISQLEPFAAGVAWAHGSGDLYAHNSTGFYSLFDKGYPIPNGPVERIVMDRCLQPWCFLGNGQIARWDRSKWTHYTCEFLTGAVQDIVFDHFENLYIITTDMIVRMRNDWFGIELDFHCTKQVYMPGETVSVEGLVKNGSWVGVLADLYIAYWNKQTGEWLFLPDLSSGPTPVIENRWVRKRSPFFIGEIEIGPAPHATGEYKVFVAFTFAGRFDAISSNIVSSDITVLGTPDN